MNYKVGCSPVKGSMYWIGKHYILRHTNQPPFRRHGGFSKTSQGMQWRALHRSQAQCRWNRSTKSRTK